MMRPPLFLELLKQLTCTIGKIQMKWGKYIKNTIAFTINHNNNFTFGVNCLQWISNIKYAKFSFFCLGMKALLAFNSISSNKIIRMLGDT